MNPAARSFKVLHSFASVAAALVGIVNSLVIILVNDALPLINYLLAAMILVIGGLGLWYYLTPALEFDGEQLIVRQSPITGITRIGFSSIDAWGLDQGNLALRLGDGQRLLVRVRFDKRAADVLSAGLADLGLPKET